MSGFPDPAAGARCRALRLLVLAILFTLAGSPRAAAQVEPLGPEFQVNVYTTGWQFSPLVTVAPDGSFTIVWCCGVVGTSDEEMVVGRRFDSSGQPLGPEFAVSETQGQYPSSVAADDQGNFVVVWGYGSSGCPACFIGYVKARRFTASGQPRGPQFAVSEPPGNAYTGGGRVEVGSDGGFVVVWQDDGSWAKRFAPDGTPLAAEFAVGGENGYSKGVALTRQPGGGFVVVWEDFDANWEDELLGQRYDVDGQPVGARIPVAPREDRPWNPRLAAAPGGDFVVTWRAVLPGYQNEMKARRFAVDGTPLGPALTVNSFDADSLWEQAIAREADGGFVVAWQSHGSPGNDTDSESVQTRRFAADGTPLGAQVQLNGWTTGYQAGPAVAVQPNGDLVMTWSSETSPGSDTSASSILARRFRVPFFMDGFETGDTSRWSATVPLDGNSTLHRARR